MSTFPAESLRPSVASVCTSIFLPWYLYTYPLHIWSVYMQVFHETNKVCSFVFLLRTLFLPWKSIAMQYPSTFNPSVFIQAASTNMIARMIGACLRVITMLFGVCVQCAIACGFVLYIAYWYLPILAILSIVYSTTTLL